MPAFEDHRFPLRVVALHGVTGDSDEALKLRRIDQCTAKTLNRRVPDLVPVVRDQ